MVVPALLLIGLALADPDVDTQPPRGRDPRHAARGIAAPSVWTPADVAAWSGEGLRGARVTGLAHDGRSLWVATDAGGVGVWDGAHWRHLDRRGALGTEALVGLAARDDALWLAARDGWVRLAADGSVQRLGFDDPGAGGVPLRADGRPRGLAAGREDVRAVVPRTDGSWLAVDGVGLVAAVGGEELPYWRPPSGEVEGLARLGEGMLAAAGEGGAWRITPDGNVRLEAADGLQGSSAHAVVAPADAGEAWLGTDRGVARVVPSGRAGALPLAPLPAGLAVADALPHRDGLAVAATDGLVWLGRRTPEGWASLRAAVGNTGTRLARTRDAWWVAAGPRLWSLDGHGEIARWEAGAEVIDLDAAGEGLAVLTTQGLRWWTPGARDLTPLDRREHPRAVSPAPDGTLWLLDGEGLARISVGTTLARHALPGGRTLVPATGDAVAVLAEDGMWVATVTELARVVAPDGGLVVAAGAGRRGGWIATAAGRVWAPGLPEEGVDLGALLPGARPLWIRPDRAGAWIGTTAGLFRVGVPRASARRF